MRSAGVRIVAPLTIPRSVLFQLRNSCADHGSAEHRRPPREGTRPPADPSTTRRTAAGLQVLFADLVGIHHVLGGSRSRRCQGDARPIRTSRCRASSIDTAALGPVAVGDAVIGVWARVHHDDGPTGHCALRSARRHGGGTRIGTRHFRARRRAGVQSQGEASVGSSGDTHRVVVGDLVNTASRLRSVAPREVSSSGRRPGNWSDTSIELRKGSVDSARQGEGHPGRRPRGGTRCVEHCRHDAAARLVGAFCRKG